MFHAAHSRSHLDEDASLAAHDSKVQNRNAGEDDHRRDSEAASRVSSADAPLSTVPNLRALLFDGWGKPVVFRSARQERIIFDQLKDFMDLDIRTIIDLRSDHEYNSAIGDRLLDRVYTVFEVQLPKTAKKFNVTKLKTTQVSLNYCEEDVERLRSFVPKDLMQDRRRLLMPVNANSSNKGNRGEKFVRGVADLATFFRFGFLARQLVEHFNAREQWRLYVSFMEYGANALCAALKLMTVPENLPVMFNCHMGKDRTGVLAALLLTIVGVQREDVIEDFTKSEVGIQGVRDEVRDYMRDQGMFWNDDTYHASPDDIRLALEFIDEKYGSVAAFLDGNGFTLAEQQHLRDNLLPESAAVTVATSATATKTSAFDFTRPTVRATEKI